MVREALVNFLLSDVAMIVASDLRRYGGGDDERHRNVVNDVGMPSVYTRHALAQHDFRHMYVHPQATVSLWRRLIEGCGNMPDGARLSARVEPYSLASVSVITINTPR